MLKAFLELSALLEDGQMVKSEAKPVGANDVVGEVSMELKPSDSMLSGMDLTSAPRCERAPQLVASWLLWLKEAVLVQNT